MNAEIFYLDGQENLVKQVQDLVKRLVYPGTTFSLTKIGHSDDNRRLYDKVERYTKLLQASIPPDAGLRLNVNVIEMFGYRIYIQVYYTFGYPMSFQDERARQFFPALAIHDRMVMVPHHIRRELAYENVFTPFELGGVVEVDFANDIALRKAMQEVGASFRTSILQELRAYASYLPAGALAVDELALQQGFDPGFIQHLLRDESSEFQLYSQLTCQFDVEKIPFNRWTKVTLTIDNQSDESLMDLGVEITGPVTVRPTRLQMNVDAKNTARIPLSIKSEDKGEFPLEITFALAEDRLFRTWLPVHHIWLTCD